MEKQQKKERRASYWRQIALLFARAGAFGHIRCFTPPAEHRIDCSTIPEARRNNIGAESQPPETILEKVL